MKRLILIVAAVAVTTGAVAQSYVKPHVRKDGTYVEGHLRSAPNSTKLDNYGTKGNYNPYTGQSGTVDPYRNGGSGMNEQRSNTFGSQCGYTQAGQYVCR